MFPCRCSQDHVLPFLYTHSCTSSLPLRSALRSTPDHTCHTHTFQKTAGRPLAPQKLFVYSNRKAARFTLYILYHIYFAFYCQIFAHPLIYRFFIILNIIKSFMFILSALGCCGLSLLCQGRENIAENIKSVFLIPMIRIWRRLFSFLSLCDIFRA